MAHSPAADVDRRVVSPLAVATPNDAAAEILPIFATMPTGVVVLLLDRDRVPIIGLAIRNAPRNEFGPIVELLTNVENPSLDSVILGVLSTDAVVDGTQFEIGDHGDHGDVGDRLTVEAATVQAWAAFAFDLRCAGLALLDVIECSSWGWASVHAPSIPYGAVPERRLGDRTSVRRPERGGAA